MAIRIESLQDSLLQKKTFCYSPQFFYFVDSYNLLPNGCVGFQIPTILTPNSPVCTFVVLCYMLAYSTIDWLSIFLPNTHDIFLHLVCSCSPIPKGLKLISPACNAGGCPPRFPNHGVVEYLHEVFFINLNPCSLSSSSILSKCVFLQVVQRVVCRLKIVIPAYSHRRLFHFRF